MTTIRNERGADADAIEAVTLAAFRGAPHSDETEHLIVRALRASGELAVSLVAEDEGRVVGHLALSPVRISDGAQGWYGLGPVSVAPGNQGLGIGSALILEGLGRLRAMSAAGCVVLGAPAYYGRFGFRAEPALVLPGVPTVYFQALRMVGALPSGAVSYAAAFSAPG